MSTTTLTANLQFTPVGAANQSTILFSTITNYDACNVGNIDIPDETLSGTSYQIPFGSIAEATGFYLKNTSGQELAFFINGAYAYNVVNGGTILIAMPSKLDNGSPNPISGLSLDTTATQSGLGKVSYMVFGY